MTQRLESCKDGCNRKLYTGGYCYSHWKSRVRLSKITWRQYEFHGLSNISEFKIWHDMRQRCSKSTHRLYSRYGGRGIKVCERWQVFSNFYVDMGPRPTSQHSIERKDNDGNYEPSNCKWATKTEQSINRRIQSNNQVGAKGIFIAKRAKQDKFGASIRINRKSIFLGVYESLEEALSARLQGEVIYFGRVMQ